jgi:hypothetical protein
VDLILNQSILKTVGSEVFTNDSGRLTVFEFQSSIFFKVNRFYYITDVPVDKSRGSHAHKSLYQAFFAIKGSFKLRVTDGELIDEVLVRENGQGYILMPGFWRDLYEFSPGAICLVLASDIFNPEDYIHRMEDFLNWRKSNERN